MKNLFSILLLSLLWAACGQPVKEEVVESKPIAENSDWKTDHLKGNVKSIEQTSYTPDSTGQIGAMDSCCIEMTSFKDDGFVSSYSEKDAEGNLTLEVKLDRLENNKMNSVTRFKGGEQKWKRVMTYDDQGKLLNAVDSDSTRQNTYYYSNITENEIGQVLKGDMHTADSTYMGVWTREYQDGMRVGSTWTDSTGTELSRDKGELNDKGWMARMSEYDMTEDGPVTVVKTFTYDSFDEAGNWTQRTEYNEAGEATKVDKRSYTYFEEPAQ